MSAVSLLRYQERKLRLFEETAESLAHSPIEELEDVLRELIPDFLQMESNVERSWAELRQRIVNGDEVDYQATGALLRALVASTASNLQAIHSTGKTVASATGRPIPRLDELTTAAERMKAMQDRVLSVWPDDPMPPFDDAVLAATGQEIERGEVETIDDVISRLERGEPISKEA